MACVAIANKYIFLIVIWFTKNQKTLQFKNQYILRSESELTGLKDLKLI